MLEIREILEEREKRELSAYACLSSKSQGRVHPESEDEIRTCYLKDRGRIVHSQSFRKLNDKTQVFVSRPMQIRTRLTHTLEVSQISRTIASVLKLNEILTEAIALGHDLGHTPFGHIGESELAKFFEGGFRHAIQSLRVVDHLEKNGEGLNLSHEVREGILKHSKSSNMGIFEKFGFETNSTLEGQIVRIADSIAYINHDIDDAIQMGFLSIKDLPKDALGILGDRYSVRIDTMVKDVIRNSLDQPEIKMSAEILSATDIVRKYMYENIYPKVENNEEVARSRKAVRVIFEYCMENLSVGTEVEKKRKVADIIASMTDSEALNFYVQIEERANSISQLMLF